MELSNQILPMKGYAVGAMVVMLERIMLRNILQEFEIV